MKQVNVSINGRGYILNCGSDEEDRLLKVVEYINEKVSQLDKVTKQSGDTNLMLATALLASNDVLDLREELASMRIELEKAKAQAQISDSLAQQNETETVATFNKLASRVESLASSIVEQAKDDAGKQRDDNIDETHNSNVIKTA